MPSDGSSCWGSGAFPPQRSAQQGRGEMGTRTKPPWQLGSPQGTSTESRLGKLPALLRKPFLVSSLTANKH